MALVLNYRDRPEIMVLLRNGSREFLVPGYVDSGSDITYIPFQIARTLELKTRSHKEDINTGGGTKIEVEHGKLDLVICDENLEEKYVFKDTRVYIPTRARDDEMLLGRQGFFDRFKVTIDERRKEITLEEH
jgi:hypothetical protein